MHNKTHPTPSIVNEKILLIEYVPEQIGTLEKWCFWCLKRKELVRYKDSQEEDEDAKRLAKEQDKKKS